MTSEQLIVSVEAAAKLHGLRDILQGMDAALLAYSGGVDSTFLLKVAGEVLGERVLAVTAVSPTYPRQEHARAVRIAHSLGARHIFVRTEELNDPRFCQNPPERCYHCKKELFGKLYDIAAREGVGVVMDGSNLDDCADYRPGRKAASEAGVRSPLVEARLRKAEIRALSRDMGLPTWDKPAMACLASRFPYGEPITRQQLQRVERAEDFLRQLGFAQLRVRSHGLLARIEVDAARVPELCKPELRQRVIKKLKGLGFLYVTLDLEGYRTGSLNEALAQQAIPAHEGQDQQ